MKLSTFLMLTFSLFSFFSSHAMMSGAVQQSPGALVVYGPLSQQGGTLEGINVMGPATFSDANIKGEAIVNGPLKAENTSFKKLQINGPVKLKKVIVAEDAVINGPLKAEGCELKDVSIATSELSLVDTTVQNITVRADGCDPSKKQTIHLDGNAIVKGKITFNSGNGVVITHGNAKDEGIIEGGKLVKE